MTPQRTDPGDELELAFQRFRRDRRPEDLGRVFDLSAARLLLVAAHLCPDVPSAEDVVQTVFVEMIERGGPGDAPALGWMIQAVKSRAVDLMRQRRRAGSGADPAALEVPDSGPGPGQGMLNAEVTAEVEAGIAGLSETLRPVLVLLLLHGLRPRQIAHALGIRPSTVRSRLARGLEQLRGRLPQSIALAALLSAGAGMAQLRRRVLDTLPASPLASLLVSGVAMKKSVLGLAVVMLLGLVYALTGPRGSNAPAAVQPVGQAAPDRAAGRRAEPAREPRHTVPVAAARADVESGIWGRVLRKIDDRPLAGALVRLRLQPAALPSLEVLMPAPGAVAVLGETRCDAEGNFRLPCRTGPRYELQVEADGYPTAIRQQCLAGSGQVIRVGRAAGVTVQVCEAGSGLPVAGARVSLVRGHDSRQMGEIRSDAHGVARISGLQPFVGSVSVQGPDHAELSLDLELTEGVHEQLRADLARGRALRGRVRDAATGEPIAGAHVTCSWSFDRFATTDAEGRFHLSWLHAERFSLELRARADGYGEVVQALPQVFPARIELTMPRAASARGRVLAPEGYPPGRLQVTLAATVETRPGSQDSVTARADVGADGRYLARGLNPDHLYTVHAWGPGLGARCFVLPRKVAAGEVEELPDIELAAEARLSGRVVDPEGNPLAGQGVSITIEHGERFSWTGGEDGLELPDRMGSDELGSDHGGRFSFAGLAAGKVTVRATLRFSEVCDLKELQLSPGEHRQGLELVLDAGMAIRGKVTFPDGREIPPLSLMIRAQPEEGDWTFTAVEADGIFRFIGLKKGLYTLTQFSSDPRLAGWRLQTREKVAAGTEGLALRMEETATIGGQVVDADGKGVEAHVFWTQTGKDLSSSVQRTGPDGRFGFDVPRDFSGRVRAVLKLSDISRRFAEQAGVHAGQTDLLLRLPR